MILQAARCATYGDVAPPRELVLAWQARSFGTLPEAGGLRDQRAGELQKIIRLLNVYEAFHSFNEAESRREWAERNPDGWQIVSSLLPQVLRN